MIPKMNKHVKGDFVFQNYTVRLGLGRMATHHIKTYQVRASDQNDAMSIARSKYYAEVQNEIGKDARIWGKMLTIDLCEVVS